ncbi:hypothetical protein TSUD_113380 [Trifolium subterraneum]|uniref:Uncharacterized protein n=1 Tax=Trifolium subterraneum TaxID=3900 RepID=A0A2Z6LFZ6_TRISU|nr:hypothetical protein TSUD_113380 [Trifolium subterraneum]
MELRRWRTLTSEEMLELEKEAANFEDKRPVTVLEEQFSASHNMDFEWAQLELSEKIEWMKKADACLYDDQVILIEGRRVLVEGAARNG